MRIALIGYGKMAKAFETLALEKGVEIVGKLSSTKGDFSCLEKADICVDFTEPRSVLENIKKVSLLKKNVVVGTTGWEKDLPFVKELVERSQIGLMYAPNLSVGVYLFRHLLKQTTKLTQTLGEYDVGGMEVHSKTKKDAPSGTAQLILSDIQGELGDQPFPFSSLRSGSHLPMHKILFDSLEDTIEITHKAKSRIGFAKGAMQAAYWLKDKRGFFTFDDFMEEKIGCPLKELSPL